MLKVKLAVNNW